MPDRNDQTPYGEQWKNGTLRNPVQNANGFFAEVVIFIRPGATPPRDAEVVSRPKNPHHDVMCWKDVEITQDQFNEMIKKQK